MNSVTKQTAVDAPALHRRLLYRSVLHSGPVLVITVYGAAWIATHASERSIVHALFQLLVLAESMVALLLRRRKPIGALAGILVAYVSSSSTPSCCRPYCSPCSQSHDTSAARQLLPPQP